MRKAVPAEGRRRQGICLAAGFGQAPGFRLTRLLGDDSRILDRLLPFRHLRVDQGRQLLAR
jgi:hypothetical protein